MTALQLAAAIAAKKVTVADVTAQYLEKARASANFVAINESALEQAAQVQAKLDAGEALSPLAGVPMALQDNIFVQGMPCACGSAMLEGYMPIFDAVVVEKLQAAGLIVIGKLGMNEFAHSPQAAAAVTAGEIPLALATDNRMACAEHGVWHIKPTYGAVSRLGLVAQVSSMDAIGPIARCVEDCAVLLEIIADCNVAQPVGSNENLPEFPHALAACEIIACAEFGANLQKFDGVSLGKRSTKAENLSETYKFSRGEGFGLATKRRVLFGSLMLAGDNYELYYTKALQVRGQVKDVLTSISAIELPVDEAHNCLANLAGLPAIVKPDGQQIMGAAFTDIALAKGVTA
ncbi:MAG: amidase family protein [Oscillospiraceae bacterium]|nr:amidase family protein [Oscillospiraceae bacterium]